MKEVVAVKEASVFALALIPHLLKGATISIELTILNW